MSDVLTKFAGDVDFSASTKRQFKVGDKGKTRGGDDYEVLNILDRDDVAATNQMVVLIDGMVSTRFIDGLLTMKPNDLDLMPSNIVKGCLCVQKSGKVTFYKGLQGYCIDHNDPVVGRIHINQEYEPETKGTIE